MAKGFATYWRTVFFLLVILSGYWDFPEARLALILILILNLAGQ